MTEWENEFRSKKIRNVSRKKKRNSGQSLKIGIPDNPIVLHVFFQSVFV